MIIIEKERLLDQYRYLVYHIKLYWLLVSADITCITVKCASN